MYLKGKEALIVDDDKNFRVLLNRILTNLGMEVIEAVDIESAFKNAQERVPHFILLDMNLSVESGLSFLESKAKVPALSKVPVIVISGDSNEGIVHRAIALGAKDYLLKPLDSERLIQKLKKIVKDAEFLSFRFKTGHKPLLIATFNCEFVGGNQSYLQIEAPLKMAQQSIVQVSGKINTVVDFTKIRLQTAPVASQFNSAGKYSTLIDYHNTNDKFDSKIKKIIENWNEIKSVDPRMGMDIGYPVIGVIDDDENFLNLVRKILSKVGFRAEIFSSTQECMKKMKNKQIHAFLIDLNIESARSGFDLVSGIRASLGPYTPIYMISGENHAEVVAEAIELGANGYIHKAVDFNRLQESLSEVLFQAQTVKEPYRLFQVPRELSVGKLMFHLTLIGADELGLKFECEHLPAKGASFTLNALKLGDGMLYSKPLNLIVRQSQVIRNSNKYEFYAEMETIDSDYSEFIRSSVGELTRNKVILIGD